jgi:hypothetical protein
MGTCNIMADDTTIEKREKGFFAHFFFWVAVGFCLFLIYVLSTGPVFKFVQGPSPIAYSISARVYAPLNWICDKSLVARVFMEWYLFTFWRIPTPPQRPSIFQRP